MDQASIWIWILGQQFSNRWTRWIFDGTSLQLYDATKGRAKKRELSSEIVSNAHSYLDWEFSCASCDNSVRVWRFPMIQMNCKLRLEHGRAIDFNPFSIFFRKTDIPYSIHIMHSPFGTLFVAMGSTNRNKLHGKIAFANYLFIYLHLQIFTCLPHTDSLPEFNSTMAPAINEEIIIIFIWTPMCVCVCVAKWIQS